MRQTVRGRGLLLADINNLQNDERIVLIHVDLIVYDIRTVSVEY